MSLRECDDGCFGHPRLCVDGAEKGFGRRCKGISTRSQMRFGLRDDIKCFSVAIFARDSIPRTIVIAKAV